MAPLALDIGPSELLIILAVVLVLFGGSRLAGLGKSAGRAIREFKDETGTLSEEGEAAAAESPAMAKAAADEVPMTETDAAAGAGQQQSTR